MSIVGTDPLKILIIANIYKALKKHCSRCFMQIKVTYILQVRKLRQKLD